MMTRSAQYEGLSLDFNPSSAFTRVPACTYASLIAQMEGQGWGWDGEAGSWVPLLHLDTHVVRNSSGWRA